MYRGNKVSYYCKGKCKNAYEFMIKSFCVTCMIITL